MPYHAFSKNSKLADVALLETSATRVRPKQSRPEMKQCRDNCLYVIIPQTKVNAANYKRKDCEVVLIKFQTAHSFLVLAKITSCYINFFLIYLPEIYNQKTTEAVRLPPRNKVLHVEKDSVLVPH